MQDSNQACKFFRWFDKNTSPCGRATAPIAWERFTRLAVEAEATKNERDVVHAMEAKAWEREWIAKCRVDKHKLTLEIAEEKLHKYRVAAVMAWLKASPIDSLYLFFVEQTLLFTFQQILQF